jgi:hypothetical protein
VRSKVEVQEKTSVGVVIANLKTGVGTIFHTPMLRSLFLIGAPTFFAFGLWNVLLLPMSIAVLEATEFEYGLQEGLTSVGFVAGSLFMAKYADRLQTGLWVFVGLMGMGIAGILYGLSPTILIGISVTVSGFQLARPSRARPCSSGIPRGTARPRVLGLFVMRDVIFRQQQAASLRTFDVRALIIVASWSRGHRAGGLVAPGVGRPRRMASGPRSLHPPQLRSPLAARPATMADFDLLVGRLATFTRLCRARRVHQRRCPRRAGARARHQGRQGDRGVLHPRGPGAAGIPEDGGYRGLSTMAAAALRRDRRPHREPAHGRRRGHPAKRLMEVPADALRGVMEVPGSASCCCPR